MKLTVTAAPRGVTYTTDMHDGCAYIDVDIDGDTGSSKL
jgi:hypothetical protein